MIFSYGFSIQGKSHIQKNIVCQDSHKIEKLPHGYYIAAVADGVGSAKNAHIGSRIAVESVCEFCKRSVPYDEDVDSLKAMLMTAYNYAFSRIWHESIVSKEPLDSYDTTLTTVIYTQSFKIVYAHAGDGAIIGLNEWGDYTPITQPQKGEDGISVVPLRSFGKRTWKIGDCSEKLVSVILMTDGMLETLSPYKLRYPDYKNTIMYHPLAAFFADPAGITEKAEVQEEIRKNIGDFVLAKDDFNHELFYKRLSDIYSSYISDAEKVKEIINETRQSDLPVHLMQEERDDKTIVVLMNICSENSNLKLHLENPVKYYSEPDWKDLDYKYNKEMYPTQINSENEGQEKSKPIEKQTAVESAKNLGIIQLVKKSVRSVFLSNNKKTDPPVSKEESETD